METNIINFDVRAPKELILVELLLEELMSDKSVPKLELPEPELVILK